MNRIISIEKSKNIPNLKLTQDLGSSLLLIIKNIYREYLSYKREFQKYADSDSVNNMGISLWKIQIFMKLFKKCFSSNKYDYFYDEMNNLLLLLENARNKDIFIEMLEKELPQSNENGRKVINILISRTISERGEAGRNIFLRLKHLEDMQYNRNFYNFITSSLKYGKKCDKNKLKEFTKNSHSLR
jgi:hypothetical protein